MTERRYYWLKLKDDFFDDKHIRYLRKMPDGDRLVIVYLRMQLFSLKTEGIIKYSTLMPSCAEELALAIDEDIEIVKFALVALQKIGLVEIWDDQTVYMAAMQECIGSEGSSTDRVRRHRERKALQCNEKALPSVSPSLLCHGEKRDKSIENKENKDTFSESSDGKPPEDDNIFFESIWILLPSTSNDRKKSVKPKRKKELHAIGYERIKQACDIYLEKQDPNYRHRRDNFFNDVIDNYLVAADIEEPASVKTGGRALQ